MNIYQTYSGQPQINSLDTKQSQAEQALLQRFQSYDKNNDGLLDQAEFRSILKDIFSKHLNQFIDDAIEETVWRTPNADYNSVKNVCT